MTDNSELYDRLLAAYSIPADDRAAWLTDMGDLFDGEDYGVVERAVTQYRRAVKPGPKEFVRVPTPEVFSDWVQLVKDEGERAAQKALPPPPRPTGAWERRSGPARATFLERHVAIGRLRALAGVSLTSFDGQLLPFHPTEAEIAGMVGQLRAQRFATGTLERIAAGETVTPAELIAAAAARKGGRVVTDDEARAAYERRGKPWPGDDP